MALGALAVIVGGDRPTTGKDPISSLLYGRHPSEPEDCGDIRHTGASHFAGEEPHQVRLVLALDDKWLVRFGRDAQREARSIVDDISPLFRPFGIELVTFRVTQWRSEDYPLTARRLLAELRGTVALADADVILALTGHRLSPTDGRSFGGTHALVSRHPGHPERDRLVAAHELGHLFGARHSSQESGGSSIMKPRGFDNDLLWDPCHERLLRLNAARFRQAGHAGDWPLNK